MPNILAAFLCQVGDVRGPIGQKGGGWGGSSGSQVPFMAEQFATLHLQRLFECVYSSSLDE